MLTSRNVEYTVKFSGRPVSSCCPTDYVEQSLESVLSQTVKVAQNIIQISYQHYCTIFRHKMFILLKFFFS